MVRAKFSPAQHVPDFVRFLFFLSILFVFNSKQIIMILVKVESAHINKL